MNSATATSARLTEQRPFVLFWLARLASTMGYQMLALTIGWQIYELTNSAFDLGLVGLIQFVPAVVLTLLIGHVADRYDRRLIVRAAHSIYAAAALLITATFVTGTLSRDLLFFAVFIIGCARVRITHSARACANACAAFIDLTGGCCVDFGQSGRCDLRTRAWRSDLCGKSGTDRPRVPDLLRLFYHFGQSGARPSAGSFPRAAHIGFGACWLSLHSQPTPAARGDYPGPVRRHSRRGHCAAACLRTGHPGRWTDRSRPVAVGACRRRLDHVARTGTPSDRKAYRSQYVRGRWNLWRGDNRVRAVDIVSALVAGSRRAWRVRRYQHRHPVFSGAD